MNVYKRTFGEVYNTLTCRNSDPWLLLSGHDLRWSSGNLSSFIVTVAFRCREVKISRRTEWKSFNRLGPSIYGTSWEAASGKLGMPAFFVFLVFRLRMNGGRPATYSRRRPSVSPAQIGIPRTLSCESSGYAQMKIVPRDGRTKSRKTL